MTTLASISDEVRKITTADIGECGFVIAGLAGDSGFVIGDLLVNRKQIVNHESIIHQTIRNRKSEIRRYSELLDLEEQHGHIVLLARAGHERAHLPEDALPKLLERQVPVLLDQGS